MPSYQIEMLWECPQCHFKDNRGLARHCVHCGKPKTNAAIERMPDDTSIAAALSGEDERKAKAGPDWTCKFCQTLQNSLEPYCQECGSKGPEPKVRHGYVTPTEQTFEVKKKSGSNRIEFTPNPMVHENIPYREFVPNTGNYRDPPTAVEPPEPEEETLPKQPFRISRNAWNFLIGLSLFASVTLIVWLLLRTKEYDVTVQNVSWRHTVEVERFHSVDHDGFDPPNSAENVRDMGMRFHHMNHLKVGSHPESQAYTYSCRDHCVKTRGVCTTTPGSCTTTPRTCTSNKNGTASCSGGDRICSSPTRSCAPDTEHCPPCTGTRIVMIDDYQDFPVPRTWYSWAEWEWTHARTVVANGSTSDTHWPSDKELEPGYALQPREQERFLKGTFYQVQFSDGKDSWTINPKSLDDFSKYPVGARYRIRASAAGSVQVISSQGSTESY